MNKYELAIVVSANIEDDERTAVVDKCKALIERFGGNITEVDAWERKKLAYEIQKMREGYYYFIQSKSPITNTRYEGKKSTKIIYHKIRYCSHPIYSNF